MKTNKLKTKSAAKKRFKVTGTGKITYRQAGKRHLLEHKSSKAKRLKGTDASVNKADFHKVKQMLPGI